MSYADLQETYGGFYNPRFEVRVGGERVRESAGVISGLQVETALGRINRFSFTVNDVFDPEHGQFSDDVRSTFVAGAPVTIRMGYGDEQAALLSGAIDTVRPDAPPDRGPTLSVSGYDATHAMTTRTGTGSWTDASLQTIVRDVADRYDFEETRIEGSDVTFRKKMHPETSDYRFLAGLAQTYGFELFSRRGTFHFRTPKTDRDPALTLRYGRSLRSFRPGGERGSRGVGTVKVRHWDPSKKAPVVGEAAVSGDGTETRVFTAPVESRSEADRRARALAARFERRSVVRAESQGLPEIRVGDVLALEGMGETYSTTYYVEEAVHRVGPSGYTTAFDASEVVA